MKQLSKFTEFICHKKKKLFFENTCAPSMVGAEVQQRWIRHDLYIQQSMRGNKGGREENTEIGGKMWKIP